MAKKKETKNSKMKLKFNKPFWITSTFVLAAVLIVIAAYSLTGSSQISESEASQKLMDFAESQGAQLEVLEVNDRGSLYEVVVTINGQEGPLYITKDGKNFVSAVVPLTGQATQNTNTNTQTETNVPQTESPEVGLFIWSYCPYGVTALGPFAEVAKLLGDSANFKVYMYYAGHGAFEEQQNKIQACIQDLDYKTEYWNYATTFSNEIYEKCYGDIDCDMTESISLMKKVGIDSEKVLECVNNKGDSLLESDFNAAKTVGVTGSPSLVINNVKTNVARNAEAYKGAVCSAFTSAPSDCDEALSTTGATASGSC